MYATIFFIKNEKVSFLQKFELYTDLNTHQLVSFIKQSSDSEIFVYSLYHPIVVQNSQVWTVFTSEGQDIL